MIFKPCFCLKAKLYKSPLCREERNLIIWGTWTQLFKTTALTNDFILFLLCVEWNQLSKKYHPNKKNQNGRGKNGKDEEAKKEHINKMVHNSYSTISACLVFYSSFCLFLSLCCSLRFLWKLKNSTNKVTTAHFPITTWAQLFECWINCIQWMPQYIF